MKYLRWTKRSMRRLQAEVESAEKRAITRALEKTAGNVKEAAELLGIHRASLYRKIEKYEMS